ncbi:hypothetical protein ACIBL6_41115 [Streptomyces sp. NPDC050400]|uniref:hypothetical protein n=1 Tax=Streptomyces sp. NPDC050400 TaxID=3365610 RepID=UPI00379E92D7
MGWVDRERIPTLEQDWRYGRLINLTRRLLEARMPACTNAGCQGGQITVQDQDGNETTVVCDVCGGSGEVGVPADNEDDGRAGGR